MGIAIMEEIVSTVGTILKTLECPICLELLKTPVSAGCGHFFCRHCVSGILQSNYRAPCPLCKRSFTRRSVQAASQRQSVISAARTLAQTCTDLTGCNFTALDSLIKQGRKSIDAKTPVPLKKFRASAEKAENASSRKRKSIENEDVEKAAQKSVSDIEMEKCAKPLHADGSSNKRACLSSEDEDSDSELPSLGDVFSQLVNSLKKSPAVSTVNETAVEKPLRIFPSDRMSNLKTYSSVHRKQKNVLCRDSANVVESKLEEKKEEYNDYFITSSKNVTNGIEKGSSVEEIRDNVQIKNKINALKNKTNEVQSDKYIQGNDSVSKLAHIKNSNENIESIEKSKENEIISSPSLPSSIVSPPKSRQPCTKKLKRSKRKSQTRLQNSSASKNMALNQKTENVAISPRNANIKDCYTLDEVNLSSLQYENQNNQVGTKKSVEDPFKSMGLTDTAISVDSVRSPLAAKTVSMIKSPGWSRVKEVKKDFKVKKFTSLDVAKNSPNISLKNVVSSDQEPVPGVDESEQFIDVMKDKVENKIDSGGEKISKDMHSPVLENETHQETTIEQFCPNEDVDFHTEIEKEMDYSVTSRSNNNNNSRDVFSANPVRTKAAVAESNIAVTKLPNVSITSNSVICANYTDTHDKISKQNVVKTKKIICEVPNTTSFNNDVTYQNGNILSKYIQDNCPEENNTLFNNHSEIKQGVFPLPSQISGYQTFHAHSVMNEDDGFQYVEQSQQTSQVFNFDLQNSLYNKLNHIVEPRVFPNRTSEKKTKVVKRTCLTLEEIQDCFLKSSQTNCSETLCSVPFLDGLFKLHIGVSDDTLNVSVLKVIETTSETNNAPQSVHLNKYIQTSNSLLPLPSILPSSNVDSESSQAGSVKNSFPYLNKISGGEISNQGLPQPVLENETSFKEKDVTLMPIRTNYPVAESSITERAVCQSNYEDDINENNMDMSEIIHFPPEPTHENKELFQKCSESVKPNPDEVCQIVNKSPLKEAITPTVEQSPFKINCVTMECDSPLKNPLKETVTLIVEQTPLKTNCDSVECDLPTRRDKNSPSDDKKAVQLDSDEFSNSDKEESLKKLEKCVHQESKGRGRKISRLSLKKRSTAKRPKVLESSDESDLENSICVKESIKKIEGVTSTSDKLSKPVSPTESMRSSRESGKKENLKNTTHPSNFEETPSTLNSLLSEDVPETNASEIVLEIEDLADKIKSLEEKLKQCDQSDLQKSLSLPDQVSSKPKIADEHTDSEDSFDLFPQSVPPTPPNRV